jgi:hypothetical protein
MIDMGVYTKGRDFRLIGSRKRIGSSKRWLWLEHHPNVITQNLFMDTLIQYKPKPIKYMVSHIIDTLNNGNPISSSLRTIVPKNSNANVFYGNIIGNSDTTSSSIIIKSNNDERRYSSPLKKIKTESRQPAISLLSKLYKYVEQTYKIEVVDSVVYYDKLILNTRCHTCLIKYAITNKTDSIHSKNTIYFVVDPKYGTISQKCHNQTHCFDIQQQRHRIYRLGLIKNQDILKGLRDWCKVNKWEFLCDIVPADEWIGDESSSSE